MPNITDEEYQWLHTQARTVQFLNPIWDDPQLKPEAQRLLKRKYPNLPIPDYDINQKIDQKFVADDAAKRKEKADADAKAQADAWKDSREKVKKQYNYTDECLNDLEKWMQEKAVADHEVSASYRASKNPRASEPTYESTHWNHEKAPGYKEISADPEAWGHSEIVSAIRRGQERMRQG